MFISVTLIAMLIRFVITSLVYENNGDKLHRRKSMRAADEELIINELGPYLMRNRKDPEIDTESTIELLCIVVAANGVTVCQHFDCT